MTTPIYAAIAASFIAYGIGLALSLFWNGRQRRLGNKVVFVSVLTLGCAILALVILR